MRLPWPSGGRGRKKQNSRQLSRDVSTMSPNARKPSLRSKHEEGGGGRDKGVSCCPRTLSCARVWRACGTINLSSDDALAALQISCRSRARSRQGFSRGWAEAHPHPGPYRVDTSQLEPILGSKVAKNGGFRFQNESGRPPDDSIWNRKMAENEMCPPDSPGPPPSARGPSGPQGAGEE